MSNPSSDSYRNPLRHMGQDYSFVPRYLRNRDPLAPTNASRDIKPKENQGYYPFGSIWNNSVNGNVWILAGIVNNLANWVLIGSSHGNILTLSDNSGTVVNPSLSTGNIQLTGQVNEQSGSFSTVVADAPNNLIILNPMSPARWIVDPLGASVTDRTNGTHTTIASAIASATSGDTIFIMPGTYTENISLKAGVNLSAFDCDAFSNDGVTNPNVTINGTTTANFTGFVCLSGICLQTNGAVALTSSSGAPFLDLHNCAINVKNATGITSTNASFIAKFMACRLFNQTTNLMFALTTIGGFNFNLCELRNDGLFATPCTLGASAIDFLNCELAIPISLTSSSITATNCSFKLPVNAPCLTTATSGVSTLFNCVLSSGTSTCVSVGAGTTVNLANSIISSSNVAVIDGAGTLNYGGLVFPSASIITTTNQNPMVSSNDAIRVVVPLAYPYTTVPQDALIKVDTNAARTIIPLANPTTGQKHIIKDTVGLAGGNNITITPSGKNIDGAASLVINTNYGNATIVYTGTEWSSV